MNSLKALDCNVPNIDGKINFINTYDLEETACKAIPEGRYGYISSSSGDLWILNKINTLNDFLLLERMLRT